MIVHMPKIVITGLEFTIPQQTGFWRDQLRGQHFFSAPPLSRTRYLTGPSLPDLRAAYLPGVLSAGSGDRFREAFVDPQQRLLLDAAQRLLANRRLPQRVGVFIGACQMGYRETFTGAAAQAHLLEQFRSSECFGNLPQESRDAIDGYFEPFKTAADGSGYFPMAGMLTNFLAASIAQRHDLKGPTLVLDTACSSSIVAIAQAVRSIESGESDAAIAGGVNLHLSASVFRYMAAAGVVSQTGRCIPFHPSADGTLLGEGAGIVYLQKARDVDADRRIFATIRAVGTASDGRATRPLAPRLDGHTRLYRSLYQRADIDPGSIDVLETHGTGTPVGDRVERRGLEGFFGDRTRPLYLSCAKANYGHLLGASGMLSLARMLYILSKRVVPPHAYLDEVARDDTWEHLCWPGAEAIEDENIRLGAINSFGFGGHNAHLILEGPETDHLSDEPVGPPARLERAEAVTEFPRPSDRLDPSRYLFERSWVTVSDASLETTEHDEAAPPDVVHVRRGEHFIRHSETEFEADLRSESHVRWLASSLSGFDRAPALLIQAAADLGELNEDTLTQCQALVRFGSQSFGQIIFVTRHAFQPPYDPVQRYVNGLLSAGLVEQRAQNVAVVDMPRDESLDALPRWLPVLKKFPRRTWRIRGENLQGLEIVSAREGRVHAEERGGIFIVLGGRSGLGRRIAEHLAGLPATTHVVVTGTQGEAPRVGEKRSYVSCDVLDKAAVERLVRAVQKEHGPIDHVILAAGRRRVGLFAEADTPTLLAQSKIKTDGIRHILEALREAPATHVTALSSISAWEPGLGVGLATYAAEHGYLEALSETVSNLHTVAFSLVAGTLDTQTESAAGVPIIPASVAVRLLHRGLRTDTPILVADPSQGLRMRSLPPQLGRNVGATATSSAFESETSASPVTVRSRAARSSQPISGMEESSTWSMLRQFIAEVSELSPESIELDDTLGGIGLDSIASIELGERVNARWGVGFEFHQLTADTAMREVVARIDSDRPRADAAPDRDTESSSPISYPLLPSQLPFAPAPGRDEGNRIIATLDISEELTAADVHRALSAVLRRATALRMRVQGHGAKARQVLESIAPPLHSFTHHIDSLTARRVLRSHLFDPSKAPLFAVYHWPGCLGMVVDHLVIDGHSLIWVLQAMLRSLRNQPLPPNRDDYLEVLEAWERSKARAKTPPTLREVFSLPERFDCEGAECHHLFVDEPTRGDLVTSRASGSLAAMVETAWVATLGEWLQRDELLMRRATHGRSMALLKARTVGSFAGANVQRHRRRDGTWSTSKTLEAGAATSLAYSFVRLTQVDELRLSEVHWEVHNCFTDLGLVVAQGRDGVSLFINYKLSKISPRIVSTLASRLCARLGVRPRSVPHMTRPWQGAGLPTRLREALATHSGTAVRTDDASMSYESLARQVHELSARITARLQGHQVVAMIGSQTTESVIGAAAIALSSGVYLPIDAAWPRAKQREILEHAAPALLIDARRRTGSRTMPPVPGAQTVVDVEGVVLREGSAETHELPGDTAYLIYTSGTTGRSKGVLVRHGSFALFLGWVLREFEFTPADTVAFTSSVSFGGSLRQIFATLVAGARVQPIGPDVQRDPGQLLDALQTVTVLNTVPQLVSSIAQVAKPGDLPNLRLVLVGGDVLKPQVLERWHAVFGDRVQMINLYGSTETIVNASLHRVNWKADLKRDAVPIGTDRPHVRVELLDADLEPVGADETGEIFVSGPSIAEGYFDAAEITQEKFVPIRRYGDVFYRTGDFARRTKQGTLTFRGRKDSQVQVHGNRVELSEIERTLEQHPQVDEACVVQRTGDGRSVLVAMCTGHGALDPSALRRWLQERLPSYMVPNFFEERASLPRTPQGKLDKRAIEQEPRGTAGASRIEEAALDLEAIWRKVLDLETVPPDADFFHDLGGDSMAVIQLFSQLPASCEVGPADFYRLRTLRKLEAALREQATPSAHAEEDARAMSGTGVLRALKPSVGFVLLQRIRPEHCPTMVSEFLLEAAFTAESWARAIVILIERHPALRTHFRFDKELQQVCASALDVDFPFVDLSELSAVKQQALLDEAYERASELYFEVNRPPLFHIGCFRRNVHQTTLVVSAHHAMADGASLQILLRDLIKIGRGEPLPVSGDFARLMRRLSAREDASRKDLYWQSRLAGAREVVARSAQAQSVSHVFSIPNRQGLFYCALRDFFHAVAEVTGQSDLVVGVATHGRDVALPHLDQVVGCFARIVPLRHHVDLAADPDSSQERLRANFQEAVQHQFAPMPPKLDEGVSRLPGTRFVFSFVGDTDEIPASMVRSQMDCELSQTELFASIAPAESDARVVLHGLADTETKQAVAARWTGMARGRRSAPGTRMRTALVGYLPSYGMAQRFATGLSREAFDRLCAALFGDKRCIVLEEARTSLGDSQLLLLPWRPDEISLGNKDAILNDIAAALRLAAEGDCQLAALAGNLPMLTRFGLDVPDCGIALTTGHNTTVATVVRTLQRAQREFQRSMEDSRLAIVGLGSIGSACLDVLLRLGHVPERLGLFDLEASRTRLQGVSKRLHREYGVHAEVFGNTSSGVDPELYAFDSLVFAVNGKLSLDIERFKPGSILVDDSFPSVLPGPAARQRIERVGDIIATGGGMLELGETTRVARVEGMPAQLIQALSRSGFPGCRAEPLLCAMDESLVPTLGPADGSMAASILEIMERRGLDASPFHIYEWRLPSLGKREES